MEPGQTGKAHMIGLKWDPKGVKEALALFLSYDKSNGSWQAKGDRNPPPIAKKKARGTKWKNVKSHLTLFAHHIHNIC